MTLILVSSSIGESRIASRFVCRRRVDTAFIFTHPNFRGLDLDLIGKNRRSRYRDENERAGKHAATDGTRGIMRQVREACVVIRYRRR